MSVDFVLLCLLLLQQLFKQSDGVDRHDATQLGLHLQQVGVGLVVDRLTVHALAHLKTALACRASLLPVVLAQAVLGLVDGLVGHRAQARLAQLAVIFALDALQLLHVNTALHQFHGNFLLRGTLLVLLHDVGNDLLLCHGRLGHGPCRAEQQEKQKWQ